jgi:hypothetical protein
MVMPRVMTAIEDLVAREASGVLEITGNPSGAVYLDAGRIAFARASWVPGLVPRLHSACPAMAAAGELLPSSGDADDAAVAGLALQHGYLTPDRLHELIASIVVDAFLVLAIPLSADSFVQAIRFTSTRTYWTEVFPRFALDAVRAEAFRQAERMTEHGLAPTTPVRLRDLGAPSAVLTREQWALACQISEPASALDLAARCGAGLADTINTLGRLTQAGLCTPVRIPRRDQASRTPWISSVGRPARTAPPGRPGPLAPRPVPVARPMPPAARPLPPSGPALSPLGPAPLGPAPSPGPLPPAGWPGPAQRPQTPPQPVPPSDQVVSPAVRPVQLAGHPGPSAMPAPVPAEPPFTGPLPARRAARGQFVDQGRPAVAAQVPSMDILRQVLSGLKRL